MQTKVCNLPWGRTERSSERMWLYEDWGIDEEIYPKYWEGISLKFNPLENLSSCFWNRFKSLIDFFRIFEFWEEILNLFERGSPVKSLIKLDFSFWGLFLQDLIMKKVISWSFKFISEVAIFLIDLEWLRRYRLLNPNNLVKALLQKFGGVFRFLSLWLFVRVKLHIVWFCFI